jgi:Flp pilus assembly secretin CpaC
MKRATGIFGWMAAAAVLAFGLAAEVRGQSTEPAFQSVVRIFVGQQTARLVENAPSARVMDASLATVAPDGDTRLLLTGLRPGRTLLTHTRKDGTPVAEQVVVMPPLSAKALEVYGLVADIPGINVYEVQDRMVIDGRLASGSDVDRVKAISDAMGENILNLTVLDTGASNDVIMDFIKRNSGVEGLTVSIFGDTAYLRGTVPSEAVRSNVVALASTQIAKVMDMLTVQTGMIETEVLFLRVEKSKGYDWGMNLFGGSSDVLGLGGNVAGSQNYAENVWSAPQIALSWSASLAPTINALVSGGQAEVVARPRIGTRIGETGRFLSGGEMYYKTAGEVSGDLNSVEYGVELTVQPQYLLDRQLCNNIKINLSYPVTQSSGADLSLDKYTIESTVVCEVGQSIVISGLTEHINDMQNEKTPLLGDIPLVRLFFSHRQRTLKDSELVAIITPRVLGRELSDARADGASEAIQAEIAKLQAQDAQAAEQSLLAHLHAKQLAETAIAKAQAEAAREERIALEDGIKARREAEREREKADKIRQKELARAERLRESAEAEKGKE